MIGSFNWFEKNYTCTYAFTKKKMLNPVLIVQWVLLVASFQGYKNKNCYFNIKFI